MTSIHLNEMQVFNRLLRSNVEATREYVAHLGCRVDFSTFAGSWSVREGMLHRVYLNTTVRLDVKGRLWLKSIENVEQAEHLASVVVSSLRADNLVEGEISPRVALHRVKGNLSLAGKPDWLRLLIKNKNCLSLVDGGTLRYVCGNMNGLAYDILPSGVVRYESQIPLTPEAVWKLARLKGIGILNVPILP